MPTVRGGETIGIFAIAFKGGKALGFNQEIT